MYIIKWRDGRRTYTLTTTKGISKFKSKTRAELQASKWKEIFPFNLYYIEKR